MGESSAHGLGPGEKQRTTKLTALPTIKRETYIVVNSCSGMESQAQSLFVPTCTARSRC